MTGEELKQEREKQQWSRRKLAEILDVTEVTIQNWEERDTVPRLIQFAFEYAKGITPGAEIVPLPKRPIGRLRAKYRDKVFLTIGETAEYLGISRRTVVDWQQRGKLPEPETGRVHDGQQWRSVSIYPRTLLDELLLKQD